MARTLKAVFEKGVLKPLIPLNIPEHKKITLTIEEEEEEPSEILSLASMIYDGLTSKDINDVEEIALNRSHFSRD